MASSTAGTSAPCTSRNMGMGALGGQSIVFKRKYRWTFTVTSPCGTPSTTADYLVKLSARPNLTIEDTEINFLNGKMWIPGKGTWETITVTFYDVGNDTNIAPIYGWLATVYNFTNPICLSQASIRGNGQPNNGGYAGSCTLMLYDGCGTVMETWTLGNAWPQAINFGELDYSSSEEVTIELTLRYSEVTYVPSCGFNLPIPCCGGC